ncbi:MAG: hypothetical protein ACFCVK_24155 [Acidimicrobiales bacterium]
MAAYGFVLVLLLVVVPPDGSFGTDDGAYGGQVHALQHGSWVLDRPLPVVPGRARWW